MFPDRVVGSALNVSTCDGGEKNSRPNAVGIYSLLIGKKYPKLFAEGKGIIKKRLLQSIAVITQVTISRRVRTGIYWPRGNARPRGEGRKEAGRLRSMRQMTSERNVDEEQ